ncbi:ABC transporter permease [Halorubrum sp. RMP-47]
MRSRLRQVRGQVWIAFRQLRWDKTRTVLAVIGIALAVLSVTLLAGVGTGVTETGNELFNEADRDLWVTGGPIALSPGSVGGFQNPVPNAHSVATQIEQHEDVQTAVPLAFQVVYVSTDGEEFETIVGSGTPAAGGSVRVTAGEGFRGPDTHYADGTYSGNFTHQALVSPELADQLNLTVGDTVHAGGTISDARANEFEVVGISPTFSNFLGTATVTLRLSELQTLTGNAYDDSATMITISTVDGVDREAVRSDLAATYPEYTFRTNQEQFVALLQQQAVVLAAGTSLVVLGVVAGGMLSLNLLLSLVYIQRAPFSVLRATGATRRSVAGIAIVQAISIAFGGYLLGAALTPPLAAALDWLAFTVTGFDGLVQVPPLAYLAGGAIAGGFALLGGLLGVWRVTRVTSARGLVS